MPKAISPRAVPVFALLVQLLSIPPLWGHQSTGGTVLGQYSGRYALVLGLHIALTLMWLAALPAAGWLGRRLRALPAWGIGAGYTLSGVVLLGLWSLSLERHALAYISLNWLLLAAFETLSLPVAMISRRVRVSVAALGTIAAAVVLVAGGITALSMNVYEPDEAHYTDYASTFLAEGRLYDRTWLSEPQPIKPGRPWSLAGYALLIERFGYDVRVGRWVNLVGYGLAFAGVFVAAVRLYGVMAAAVTTAAMALSYAFLPQWEFRPNHWVTAAGAWCVVLLIAARQSQRVSVGLAWHLLTGVAVTLALNVHAAMIVFAAAFSSLYAGEAVYRLVRPGDGARWQVLLPVMAFGGGALLGTLIYIGANVLPVGGFSVYLGTLGERLGGGRPWTFFYTRWDSLYEKLLIAAGVLYIAWRRTDPDRFVLALLGLLVGSAVLLDSEGYIWHVAVLYFVPLGAMLTAGFTERPTAGDSRRVWWVTASALLVLAAQLSSTFVDWNAVRVTARTGSLPPYFYAELKTVLPDHIHDDDVIYSTHQLIWLYPHRSPPQLVSYAGERNAMRRWSLAQPVQVWERVQPTVLVFVDGQMTFDPGMVAYMERYPFEVCQTLTVQGRDVLIYRTNCNER